MTKLEEAREYEKRWRAFCKANDAWLAAGCPEGPLCEAWENAYRFYHAPLGKQEKQ